MPGLGFFEVCQIAAAWMFAAGGRLEEKESERECTDKEKGGLFSCLLTRSSGLCLGERESGAAVQPTTVNKGLLHGGEGWGSGEQALSAFPMQC